MIEALAKQWPALVLAPAGRGGPVAMAGRSRWCRCFPGILQPGRGRAAVWQIGHVAPGRSPPAPVRCCPRWTDPP